MLQCPGPALGNENARWDDGSDCRKLAAFVNAVPAQKVGQMLNAPQIPSEASAVPTERF